MQLREARRRKGRGGGADFKYLLDCGRHYGSADSEFRGLTSPSAFLVFEKHFLVVFMSNIASCLAWASPGKRGRHWQSLMELTGRTN